MDNPDVDHEALLRRYIQHVRDCEGIDFLDSRDWGRTKWTDAEWNALEALRPEEGS